MIRLKACARRSRQGWKIYRTSAPMVKEMFWVSRNQTVRKKREKEEKKGEEEGKKEKGRERRCSVILVLFIYFDFPADIIF